MSRFKLLLINLKRSWRLALVGVFLCIALSPVAASAQRIGVGVGTGKIHVDEDIKPSLIYEVPSVAVFNNGDVTSEYEMSLQYNETQPELKPPAEWVSFSPQRFTLEAGKSQEVKITLSPANSARPGDYFAYLEAHPIKTDASGTTVIQIAAATKFSFKIVPANIFQRLWYFLIGLWQRHKPIILIIVAVLVAVLFGWVNKKFLKIQISRGGAPVVVEPPKETKKKSKKKKSE